MQKTVQQLFPGPVRDLPLNNLYLSHDIRQLAAAADRPFVYANFVTSLDGRIAISREDDRQMIIPKNVANERDWRLFQELAAQADLIISSGRYLRDWAAGKAQEILQVDDPRFADLRRWREQHGLPPHPDIAILSQSLTFPLPEVLTAEGRRFIVFTGRAPDPRRVKEIEAKAGKVLVVGEQSVDGQLMFEQMRNLGYQSVYSAAGPKVLHTLLAADVLDRLYITLTNRLLGSAEFATIVDGPILSPSRSMEISTVYLDRNIDGGMIQLFLSYNRAG
jgi:riboflavin biosynthesis pyrimidine reductase